jgi:Uma2 family endonuclease
MSDLRLALKQEQAISSYEEYRLIEERVEVIDGVVYAMSSPTDVHQDAAGGVYAQLLSQLRGKRCHPYIAPFDVRLPAKSLNKAGRPSPFTIVQPDVFILCDPTKNKSVYIDGAPDFIMEVLSNSTRSKDTVEKLNKYAAVGVREYWMLDPVTCVLTIAVLDAFGFYEAEELSATGVVYLRTFEGLRVDFDAGVLDAAFTP